MQKWICAVALFTLLISCNNTGGETNTVDNTKSNAAANDSTQAPNGITTGEATSTNPNATKTRPAQQNDSTEKK